MRGLMGGGGGVRVQVITTWTMCSGGDCGAGADVGEGRSVYVCVCRGRCARGVKFLITALQIMSIRLQNSFSESHTWTLVRWKAQREKLVQHKKDHRTNIISTNFVWEQLMVRRKIHSKSQIGQAKILHKKAQQAYNNCFKL